MSTCESCGGIIGRDCFNPVECAHITRQQEQFDRQSERQTIQQLRNQLATEKAKSERLRRAMCVYARKKNMCFGNEQEVIDYFFEYFESDSE